jgi:hypothetical protein
MVRTTDALVGGVIEVDASITLTPFINVANELVTECCTGLATEYTDARLILIETWLAAHFYSVRDMRAVVEKAGPVSEHFQSKVDLGFDTSHYGQMAMRLDTQGGLTDLNEKTKKGISHGVGVTWLGTEDPTDTAEE